MLTILELVLLSALILTVVFTVRFCIHNYQQQR